MNIVKQHHGSIVELRLNGRLDATTAPRLRQEVQDRLEAGQRQLVIELAGVDFIDSTGLGGLVTALRTIVKEGGMLKLAAIRAEVRRVFELTRLDKLFEIFPDTDAAVASFSS
ncbi:MAG: hypothetical protein BWK76_19950 [Desulfobulbaceae bacterium A2]|nr:MAG: hypothetical protein BWK76_19950 [Desulfobulbaceae bacterium A2]